MKRKTIWIGLIILWMSSSMGSAYFDIITFDKQSDFLGGRSTGIMIDPDGRLTPAASLEEIWCSDTDGACWNLAVDAKGVLYAATGNDGKIYRSKGSEMELFFDAPQVALFSILPLKNGSVLAGAAPDGIVYRIESPGQGTIFYRTEAHYIWDMIQEPDGNILLATGLPAAILRLDSKGNLLEKFDLKTDHARTMTMDGKGNVWIGTAATGRIYHLNRSDIQLVYDTFAAEISDIAVDSKGLWFSTVAAPSVKGSSSKRPENLTPRKRTGEGLDEHGTIWFLDFDSLSAQEMMKVDRAPVFALTIFDTQPVVACGDQGNILRIDQAKRSTLLTSLTEQPLVSLVVDKQNNLLAGSGGSACIWKLSSDTRPEGSYESEPIDAENTCKWGRLTCQGFNLTEKNCILETRTGNTDDPDDEWSDWSMLLASNRVGSPSARYLQYRLTLKNDETRQPVVDSISISLKTVNHQPYIEEVTVYPATQGQIVDLPSRGKSFRQFMADGLRVEYVIPNGPSQGLSRSTWQKLRGMRTISWKAGDDDNDQLSYTIEIAAVEPHLRWFPLVEDINSPVHSFDSSAFQDGRYVVKVTASDRSAHPVNDVKTISLESRMFEIDNTSPELRELTVSVVGADTRQWTITVSGTAWDGTSNIRKLQYSLDADQWYNFSSSDSMLDAPEESFELILKGKVGDDLPSIVFLKVFDAQENTTTSTINVE